MNHHEFETIQQTLTATERGKGFLDEFARRQRAQEADRLLNALERIESYSARLELERTRQRRDSERAAQTATALADLLKELHLMTQARRAAQTLNERAGPLKPTALEKRFNALVHLDSQEFESNFKLFG